MKEMKQDIEAGEGQRQHGRGAMMMTSRGEDIANPVAIDSGFLTSPPESRTFVYYELLSDPTSLYSSLLIIIPIPTSFIILNTQQGCKVGVGYP